ncbi:hypothetical protein Kuja_0610 [Vibrio phage vB_VchM_Kuja]|uniref:Baseplate wedge subunit n=1 Tax=Vibrio phage vB_VchM_Kuja TaxID=2686437 RepID=A0A6B9JBV7_9CAUD|nr:hypothetical protein HWC83_gp175 [Vibrio phage vB_VchM_Kuja]QGZ16052.1 hypothetical protein Kuja_0610 [Vibrio phage vB_VchM_Kuja]
MNDFDLTFKRHPITGDVAQRNGTNAILQSVRNIVLTASGDWKAEQGLGVGVYKLLGENSNGILTLLNLKTKINEQLSDFEKRIEIKQVDIKYINEDYGIKIYISFIVKNMSQILELTETINVLR